MEIDKASEYFVKAIDLDGMNDSAFFYLGYCYLNKNNLDKARCMYEKCLQINPHHSLALLDLGWASYLQGDITEAVHYYNKSLVINPNVDSTLLNLVNCMIMQEKKEETCYLIERISSLQGLVDYTHRLIVLDPLNSYLYHDLGIISMIKGDLHKALISFQKCLEININYIYKGFLLSQILLLNNCI